MVLLTAFIPQREKNSNTLCDARTCVHICECSSYIIQSVESERGHMKDIRRPVFDTIYLRSAGRSGAVHWPTVANEIGDKIEGGGLAVIR